MDILLFTQIWDLMDNVHITAAELFTWHRFLQDWLSQNQIDCVGTDFIKSNDYLNYITAVEDNNQNLKSVVIPLSKTIAIVVESRRSEDLMILGLKMKVP
jgi:hypothetical protein